MEGSKEPAIIAEKSDILPRNAPRERARELGRQEDLGRRKTRAKVRAEEDSKDSATVAEAMDIHRNTAPVWAKEEGRAKAKVQESTQ